MPLVLCNRIRDTQIELWKFEQMWINYLKDLTSQIAFSHDSRSKLAMMLWNMVIRSTECTHKDFITASKNTLLKPKRHSLCCHDFMVHALLLRMHTNVVYFRVMRRLCRHKWNWLWNWRCVNQHSWDPWQRTTWSWCVTSDFNSVLSLENTSGPTFELRDWN